ncbi:MAG: hypothetical protein HC886_11735 [Leptolyngbyaceae cyanobacterium SM1_1_3]|nr:hypothetical protein [Leptolyngbyaceae cyanobacterium SM1_1_3]NJM85439.1 hypothetical protein [Leptolyngbyaceae cyanobacterium RM2_2_21]NJN01803.1 hypothetical protein [Leptolyngbyaceae cyanobacterium RM1_1_2]NJO11341.1 hypothetical protein [Leptolyngbyaceae cyanobacterium SL_1_1]
MNQNDLRQLNFSGLGCWLTLFATVWLLGALGLGWLIKSFLVLMVLLVLAPVVAFLGFRWWLRRNLVVAQCPVCNAEVTGVSGMQATCLNCGTQLKAEANQFKRVVSEGIIDIDAVEVNVEAVELPPSERD